MTGLQIRNIVGLAALGFALAAPPTHAGWLFTNFSLGGPQGAGGTTINGINNDGSVVGFGQDSSLSVFSNFAGPPGVPSLLNVDNSTTAMANGINSSNEVVGGVNGSAFTLTNNFTTFNTLTPFSGTTVSETAAGINDHGVIVGQYSDSATGLTPGFVYNHGTYTLISSLFSSSESTTAIQLWATGRTPRATNMVCSTTSRPRPIRLWMTPTPH
jgi:hypothetical protein